MPPLYQIIVRVPYELYKDVERPAVAAAAEKLGVKHDGTGAYHVEQPRGCSEIGDRFKVPDEDGLLRHSSGSALTDTAVM